MISLVSVLFISEFNAERIPCDAAVSSKNQSLENIVAICGRYATYLRLYNSAVILLIDNLNLCLKLVDYVEFLEVFLLRNNGVNQLCHLLQLLTSRRLKSVGFCFSKVSGVELWSRIFDSLSTNSPQNQTDKVEDNFISTCMCISSPNSKRKAFNEESKFSVQQTCNQSNCGHSKTASVQVDSILNYSTDANEEGTLDSFHENDDIDIYAFDDWNDSPKTHERTVAISCRGTKYGRGEKRFETNISDPLSSDLYDEVFGQSTYGQPSDVMVNNFCPFENQGLQKSSEPHQFSPKSSILDSSLTWFPTHTCFLVHFELVGFRLYTDIFMTFVHTLKTWLALETMILQDNGLGLVSTPGREFVDTLSFLCTNGGLHSLQITDNPVNDEFTKLLFERLVVSLCCKCYKDCNCSHGYLTKLKFSSNIVSPSTSVYLGKVITDVCQCNVSKQFQEKMFDSVFPLSDSAMSTEDSTHESRSKQRSSYVHDCLACKSGKGGWKASCPTGDCDGAQKPSVGCKMNAEPTESTESIESFSQNKNPLLSKSGMCDVFFGIQVMKLSCMIGEKGASFIAEGLKRNSTLHSLTLSDCDINTIGLAQLFQALTGKKHLT